MTARPLLAELLDLQPHPEGGWFRETWRSPVFFRPAGYVGDRSAATAIYFLLCPGEESAWHVVRSDELWLFHRGGPLALRLGGTGAQPADASMVVLGADIGRGEQPQAIVPGGTWQRAAPVGQEPTLVSCVVAPGFNFADFRLG
jgi:predicted cupin superfamily sugar epimerase